MSVFLHVTWLSCKMILAGKAWHNLLPKSDIDLTRACLMSSLFTHHRYNICSNCCSTGKGHTGCCSWVDGGRHQWAWSSSSWWWDCSGDTRSWGSPWSSDDEEAAASPPVTASEVFDALDITLCWFEQISADATHLLLVKNWYDEAAWMEHESMKQA